MFTHMTQAAPFVVFFQGLGGHSVTQRHIIMPQPTADHFSEAEYPSSYWVSNVLNI